MAKAKVPIWGSTGKALIFDPEAGERALAAIEELRALIARQSSNQYHRDLLELQVGDDHPQYAMWQARETIIGQWDFTKPIWASNGSDALPAYTFTSDTNLGFYRVGADNLGLSTNGTLRWDVGTTRVNQTLPLRIQSNSGFLLQNEGAGGFAGIEMLSFNGADPTQECGNRLAFWESPDRLYGFRFEHEGDINLTGDLDFYRHNNSAAGVLFMRFTRDSSQVQFTDGTLSEPTLTFIGDTDLGLYRFAADHLGIGADNVTHTGSDATSTSFITRNSGAGTAGYTVANTAGTQVVRFGYSNASSRPFINVQVAADMTFQQAGTVCIDFIATAGHWQTRDNVELRAGTGGDLRLFHDATNSTIRNDTGNLSINSGTTEVLRFIQGANSRVHGLNGTAALPTFGWFGDPNNGLYYITTDSFGISTAGTLRFQFGAAGQLGIGGATYGTAGQALISGGASAAPSWGNHNDLAGLTTGDPHTQYPLAAGTETISGAWTFTTTPIISNTSPILTWDETDGGVDQRFWRMRANTAVFVGDLLNDDGSAGERWLEVNRSGSTVTSIGFPNGIVTMEALIITSTAPNQEWKESDQGVDEKNWDLFVQAKHFMFRTKNDADSSASNIIDVTRGTGIAVSDISFGNATDNPSYQFLGTGNFTFNGTDFIIQGASPRIVFYETDVGANLGKWRWRANSNLGILECASDDFATTGRVLQAERNSSSVITDVQLSPTNGAPIRLPNDNQQLRLGAGNDLRLYHDGTNSIIENDTGNLVLMVNGELSLSEVTTGTTSPAAGGAGALPATPTGYVTVIINGSTRQIPYY